MNKSKFTIFVSLLLFLPFFITISEGIRVKQNYSLVKSFFSPNITQADSDQKEAKLLLELKRYQETIDLPIPKLVLSKFLNKKRLAEIRNGLNLTIKSLPASRDILGFEGVRKYLIVFQNPAEARGTGGIIGGFAVIKVQNGHFQVANVGANTDLKSLSKLPIEMPNDYKIIYGDDPAIWQNSNYSPDFPSGARIWLALWRNQTGENLDGVFAVDPFVLKEGLKVIGPLRLSDGSLISSTNVIQELLSNLYLKYGNNYIERKRILVEVVQLSLNKLLQPDADYRGLAIHFLNPLNANRVLFYSNHNQVQKIIEKTKLGGSLNWNDKNQIKVVIQNTSGNKLDYYLKRSIIIERLQCGGKPRARVKVTLVNTVSAQALLPNYVKGRLDLNRPSGKNNSHGVTVFVYGPNGAQYLLSGKSTGNNFNARIGKERNRPLFVTKLELIPEVSNSFFVDFSSRNGKLSTYVQPLVIDQSTRIFNNCPNG